MSLFKAKEWWHTHAAADNSDEFGPGALCVANLDNNPKGSEKIIVGSFNGTLRIFDPALLAEDDTTMVEAVPFRPEHLLVEKNLESPVIQVAFGRFVSGSDRSHLAVLQPRKLSVFNFATTAGQIEHGHQYSITSIYEHSLKRSAYNFAFGPFGGVKNRDFICIQSLDGVLSFYENENFAFSRFLPSALLPGPLVYASNSDSFVTVSSVWQLESYKYQTLAVAADSQSKEEAELMTTGKRVAADWAYKLGESVLDVRVVEMSPCTPSILVLGERNLFCFTEGGMLRFMKKFELNPTCIHVYTVTAEGWIQYLISSTTNTILLFCDTTLKWATQTPNTSVALTTGKFGFVKGLMVNLSDDGYLSCAYLGTDPALYGIPRTESRQIDYPKGQKEFSQLQKVIRTHMSSDKPVINAKSSGKTEELTVACQLPPKLDEMSVAQDSKVDSAVPSMTAKISLNARIPLENVQLQVVPPPPFNSLQRDFAFGSLLGSEDISASFYLQSTFIPATLTVPIRVSASTHDGGSKTWQSSMLLPLPLIAKSTFPPKTTQYKFTIDSNKPCVSLNDLFPEFVGSDPESSSAAMGFQLYGQGVPAVSILASKTNSKYRVQSDNFELTWIFLSELLIRLKRYHVGVADFSLTFSGGLPLADYFVLIDHHFELRKRKEKLEEILAQRCTQLRAVQKRLLVKYKDITPSPLSHLDGLLEMTYRQIMTLGNTLQEVYESLASIGCSITAATQLLLTLIQLQNRLSREELISVKSAFSQAVDDHSDYSWEDRVDAAVTHLLSKVSGRDSNPVAPANMEKLRETTRLKKHITQLCDKLSKGAHMATSADLLAQSTSKSEAKKIAAGRGKMVGTLEPIAENSNAADLSDAILGQVEMPIGATFGLNANPTDRLGKPVENRRIANTSDDDFFEGDSDGLISRDREISKATKMDYLEKPNDQINNSIVANGNNIDDDDDLEGLKDSIDDILR